LKFTAHLLNSSLGVSEQLNYHST